MKLRLRIKKKRELWLYCGFIFDKYCTFADTFESVTSISYTYTASEGSKWLNVVWMTGKAGTRRKKYVRCEWKTKPCRQQEQKGDERWLHYVLICTTSTSLRSQTHGIKRNNSGLCKQKCRVTSPSRRTFHFWWADSCSGTYCKFIIQAAAVSRLPVLCQSALKYLHRRVRGWDLLRSKELDRKSSETRI